MSDPWDERLKRLWAEVVLRDSTMAPFSSASDLLFGKDHLVGSFVVGATNGKALVRRYIVRVSYMTRNGKAVTGKALVPQVFTSKDQEGLTMRAEIMAANDISPSVPQGSAHEILISDAPDDAARIDRLMAVQLLHEMYHARLLIERDSLWPETSREILPIYNAWAAPVWTATFEAERDKVAKSIGLERLGRLLNEKFAIELAFDQYGIAVPNKDIVEHYLRDEKEAKLSIATPDMLALFDKLDQVHRSYNVQMRPGPPRPKPWERRPGSDGVQRQPRYMPAPAAPRRSFLTPSAPLPPRYRPNPVIPRAAPIPPMRPPPAPPALPAYKRFPPPAPPPRPYGGGNPYDRSGSNRSIMGGRIGPLSPPPPPPRYRPLPRGGSGWNPGGYAFSNLGEEPWRPSFHYEPHTRSWD